MLGALVWTVGSGTREAALAQEPMVYIEPAPPPAPGPVGPLTEPAPPEAAVPEPPAPTMEPKALVEPRPTVPRKPPVVPKRAPRPAEPAPPSPAPAGEPGGVAGGERGGLPGGIPGGTGSQAIPLALAGRPPVVITRVTPTYPPLARERRVEGVVVLRAVVDASGHVTRLQVVQSVPLLDDAAQRAFEQWRFTPGRDRDGNVVAVLIEVPMRFKLE